MEIVNLTPHNIRILSSDKITEIINVPPSGIIARVTVTRTQAGVIAPGIPIFVSQYGDVTGVPTPTTKIVYLVSAMVRQALPNRMDVLSPGELVRGTDGQPIGCCGLDANQCTAIK